MDFEKIKTFFKKLLIKIENHQKAKWESFAVDYDRINFFGIDLSQKICTLRDEMDYPYQCNEKAEAELNITLKSGEEISIYVCKKCNPTRKEGHWARNHLQKKYPDSVRGTITNL